MSARDPSSLAKIKDKRTP